MKKIQAIEEAERHITKLQDRRSGGWGFSYRETLQSPWVESESREFLDASSERRAALICKARELMGKPTLPLADDPAKRWHACI